MVRHRHGKQPLESSAEIDLGSLSELRTGGEVVSVEVFRPSVKGSFGFTLGTSSAGRFCVIAVDNGGPADDGDDGLRVNDIFIMVCYYPPMIIPSTSLYVSRAIHAILRLPLTIAVIDILMLVEC